MLNAPRPSPTPREAPATLPLAPLAPLTRTHPADLPLDEPPITEAFVGERRWRPDITGGLGVPVLLTNVPHLVTNHSPSGFEWGYGGSGPADLALNILEATLRLGGYVGPRVREWDGTAFRAAVVLHQRFKAEVVAAFEEDGFRLPLAQVAAWLETALREELRDPGVAGRLARQFRVETPDAPAWAREPDLDDEVLTDETGEEAGPPAWPLAVLRDAFQGAPLTERTDGIYRGIGDQMVRVARSLTLAEYDALARAR